MTPNSSRLTTARRVVVGMSGGVDSSVAALLLKQRGFIVEGLFMKNWEEDDGTEYCTDQADFADAKAVCEVLDVPLHQVNFAAEYWHEVFQHCLQEFRLGRTPNPDVLCNRQIKFKRFLDYALTHLDADAIATGHYARLAWQAGQLCLLKGADNNKDQSYFLHDVDRTQFEKVMFPLGDSTKAQVRVLAREAGLVVHNKPDSTGICFIGERRFVDFLKRYLAVQPGDIVDTKGVVIGTHDGLPYYTIGQRQGLRIGGLSGYEEMPWYVVSKDMTGNKLITAQGNDHASLFSYKLRLDTVRWLNEPRLPWQGSAKCRYRQADQPCLLRWYDGSYEVEFEQPQRAVTPGQSLCLYQGDLCLGGGVIHSVLPAS